MKEKLLLTLFAINLTIGIPTIILGILNTQIPTLLILSTVIQITTSYFIIKETIRDYNIDLLFLLSTSTTYLLSLYGILIGKEQYFHVSAILILVYYTSKIIEQRTYKEVKKTFSDLYKILPKKVMVLREGKKQYSNIKNLSIGDTVIISSGKKIPVDGTIIFGSSCIDESLVTGESQGIEKTKNDKVMAGTLVVDGLIRIRVERVGKETYLSQIIHLIEKVEESKTKNRKKLKTSYKIFMSLIISAFILTFLTYFLTGTPTYDSLKTASTILIISSNASLVLATPVATIFSIITLTKKGIVTKNPKSIEMIPEINRFVLDKTGTITEGKLEVNEIIPLGVKSEKLVKYFLIAEKHSSHTLAKSLYKQLKKRRVPEPDYFREYFGMGVHAKYKERDIHVGRKKLLEKFGIETESISDLENKIVISLNKKPIGIINFKDTLKESSKHLLEFLKKRNSELIMLTGDKKRIAMEVADELGIERVYSEVAPEKKLEIVKKLREEGRLVMIGDGINDAPSLAQADVGISVNNQIDLIKESSDIVLIRNDLQLIETLIRISDFTKTKIKQNIFWTYSYNLIAVLIASGLFVKLGLSVTPLIACASSISSTLSIMINSFLHR